MSSAAPSNHVNPASNGLPSQVRPAAFVVCFQHTGVTGTETVCCVVGSKCVCVCVCARACVWMGGVQVTSETVSTSCGFCLMFVSVGIIFAASVRLLCVDDRGRGGQII